MENRKRGQFGITTLLIILGSLVFVSAAVINSTNGIINATQLISLSPNEIAEVIDYGKINNKIKILVVKIKSGGA